MNYLYTFACFMAVGLLYATFGFFNVNDAIWFIGSSGSALLIHWIHFSRNHILVPREPTEAMIQAGIAAWTKSPLAVVTQYKAMVEAADAG